MFFSTEFDQVYTKLISVPNKVFGKEPSSPTIMTKKLIKCNNSFRGTSNIFGRKRLNSWNIYAFLSVNGSPPKWSMDTPSGIVLPV